MHARFARSGALLGAVLLSAAAVVGCASAPGVEAQGPIALSDRAIAPDKSRIVILRGLGASESLMMPVRINGQPAVASAAGSYLYQDVDPGKHTVTASAHNTDTLEVEAKAGQSVYIRQVADVTFTSAQTRLRLLSEDEGRRLAWKRY